MLQYTEGLQYDMIDFKVSHCFKVSRLFICTKTANTSYVVEHLGKGGLFAIEVILSKKRIQN